MFSFLSRLTLYESIVNVFLSIVNVFNSRKGYYRQGQDRIGLGVTG